jgi:hypothetical protein
MEQQWASGVFGLIGVITGGATQYVLFKLKYRTDSQDRIRELKARFSADVFQYVRLVRDIEHAEMLNKSNGKIVAVPEVKRADVSDRYRAVVASTNALMACADDAFAEMTIAFLRKFDAYADAHRNMSTGDGGPYPTADELENSADLIRKHQPSLRRKRGNGKRI